MNINEGNIFEAMRLVLPEHRGVMASWKRQRSAKEPPTLSEDEMENIQYVLSEAIQNGYAVRLKLFVGQANTMLEGVLTFDGRLRIATGDGVRVVDMAKLIAIELV